MSKMSSNLVEEGESKELKNHHVFDGGWLLCFSLLD